MTTPIMITLLVISAAMALFAWNRFPAAIVALSASLILHLSGILTAKQIISGFGDPVVILIAALLAIAAGLEISGVSAWAGQLLIRQTGTNSTKRLVLIMILAALFSGLIGMNGAVAAMLPITALVAIRTETAPSKMLIPLAFACLTGAKLTLLGSPVNVIAAAQIEEVGLGRIGFFEWAVLGIPLLAGTILITIMFGPRLLPERRSKSIPADLSTHAHTLVEQYQIESGLHHLRIRASSPYVATPKAALSLEGYDGLNMLGVLDGKNGTPLQRDDIQEGDVLLLRGGAEMIGRFASDKHLAIRGEVENIPIADALLNKESGLAEVVLPSRSKMIGQAAFPGMTTEDGGLMILAIQREGVEVRPASTILRAGDHLLLQGTWKALDEYLGDPQVMVVDSPEVVRKQAVALGKGAGPAIAILVLLMLLLSFSIVTPPVATVLCAVLMVIFGVLQPSQVYRNIDWNTCILIGGMIPLATAMAETGAAELIGDFVVDALGAGGPLAVLAGIFCVTALVSQFISNTSSALVMLPIGMATANELEVSAIPLMMGVAMGASASFLTPFANGVSAMTYGPGGYQFGDYWKLGILVMVWALLVTLAITPLYWSF